MSRVLPVVVIMLNFWSAIFAQDNPDAVKRLKPPSPAQLSELQENLRFVYKSDYEKIQALATNSKQQRYARMALGRKIWNNARNLKPSDSGFYPSLREVMRLSVQTQRPKAALDAIELLAGFYAVNATRLRTIVFENAIKKGVRLDDVKASAGYLNRAIQIAVLTDLLEDAKLLVTCGELIAARIVDRQLRSEMARMVNTVDELLEQKFQAGASQRRIENGTATQSDFTKVALYHGLRKNNWSDAEMYAGELKDDKLRQMFVKEIVTEKNLVTTIELANGWWEFGSKQTGILKTQAIEIAALRYAVSMPVLEGFNKQIAESRLKTVNKQLLLTRLWRVQDYGDLAFLWLGAFESPRFINSIGMGFVAVPAGTFIMGDSSLSDATPHQVTLTKPFQFGAFEVTQSQYERIMGHNPSGRKGPNLPVNNVTFEEAKVFCEKLSRQPFEDSNGYFYRLPTEAEWEYCCRAGTTTSFYWGDDYAKIYDHAWMVANSNDTVHVVGTKLPNKWGIHDMIGNVNEYILDAYTKDYPSKNAAVVDPLFVDGNVHSSRGGDYKAAAEFNTKSASRNDVDSNVRKASKGFRVVRLKK